VAVAGEAEVQDLAIEPAAEDRVVQVARPRGDPALLDACAIPGCARFESSFF
jgi:hypothetical protein